MTSAAVDQRLTVVVTEHPMIFTACRCAADGEFEVHNPYTAAADAQYPPQHGAGPGYQPLPEDPPQQPYGAALGYAQPMVRLLM